MPKKKTGSLQGDEVKKLEDFETTKPYTLTLFDLIGNENKPYNRTIELYDFIPKYFWGKADRTRVEKTEEVMEVLPSLRREFECRGKKYVVRVKPARLDDKDGVERDYYPGPREEAVEDALRKIACEGRSRFLDDRAGVVFTLHELQKELKRTGHTFSKDEIKEALRICKRTNLIVTTLDGDSVLESSIFETLGLATFEDWKTKGKDAKCFVRFNALVTNAIQQSNFRRFNYEKAWSYKSVIARQLHKRLSHHYTQAGSNNNYSILLTTLIRDFGLTRYSQLRNNLEKAKEAFEEMKTMGVIDKFQIETIVAANQHNKLEDAKITIWTSYDFDMEVKETNRSMKPPTPTPSTLFPKR